MNIQANTAVSYFDVGDDSICVKTSLLTGKEEVFVNDKCVSEKRSLRFKSTHPFSLKGDDMAVSVSLLNWLKGPYLIELQRGGEVIDSDQWDIKRIRDQQKRLHQQQPLWKRLLVTFGFGLVGALLSYSLVTLLLNAMG